MSNPFFDTLGAIVGGAIDHWGWADRKATALVINKIVESTRNRPHPWSTASDYTSWKSLTDRTYQARHLPAAAPRAQPTPEAIKELFRRPAGQQLLSKKSTCLFPAFAQYLTDGFIRTDPHARSRTTSNHEIDLCPLYGRNEPQTLILREQSQAAGRKGRLKSQIVNGEEYPPFLYESDGSAIKAEFVGLDKPLLGPSGAPDPAPEKLASLFAVGGG